MDPRGRPQVLCVDDEPHILEGLALTLRRRYTVVLATSGAQGLELLKGAETAVIVSDMRMPGMDGVAFLSQARQVAPDAVRILLTGQADLASSIAVINEGQIFRFLTKPCAPPVLQASVDAAAEQHRLLSAERVLLEQTLHGSIQTLIELLTLTSPSTFGRATRLKQRVSALLDKLGLRDRWQVEVAAMLSQLGYVTLPPETVERVAQGAVLTEAEQQMVARLPAVTQQLLGHIPRLEVVRGILAAVSLTPRAADPALSEAQQQLIARGAQLLLVALDADLLEAQGHDGATSVEIMRGRAGRYDPAVLEALGQLLGRGPHEIRELPLSSLISGMVLAEDVRLQSGALLVARGFEVTLSFLERLRNYKAGTIREPLRVVVRRQS